ncbi:uncharacterized protein LOC134064391 [Sardina pilchardus]|uniref:uncharacterized protein LOC134064391 n=1 Tax=Sardina pilchardus TaxID=27697 RepID=UPI002E11CE4E
MTTHANFYMKTSLPFCGRMNVASEPLTDCKHAVALLRGLNLQREYGQFCDCVIQLHINPGRLFLAHKSVLAASSPVLASLLTSQGALLDLQSPCLSPETMEYLLDFIYTGKLPPKSQEDSVLSVAVDLQMQELQYALIFRRSTLSEFLNIQDKLDRKRPYPEEQHEEGNLMSPSFPHRSKRPLTSCSSCEAVPVIRHASACGKLSPMQESSTPNYDLDIASDQHGRESDSRQSVHLPSYRHKQIIDHNFQNMDKNDDNSFEPVSKRAKVVSHVLPPDVLCHQTETPKDFEDELLESGSDAFVKTSITVSPKTVCVSAQIRHARHKEEDLSPHAKASRGLILSDASRNDDHHGHLHLNNSHYEHIDDASHRFRPMENDPSKSHASLEFSDVSANIPVDSSDISEAHVEPGQRNVLCHLQSEDDQPYAVHVAISREKYHQGVDMQTCRSSDSKPLFDLDRCNAQDPGVSNHSITADSHVVLESARDDRSSTSETSSIDQEEDYDLFGPQISSMHTYLGQVRYHCISREPRSSDSDEDGLYGTPADTASRKLPADTASSTVSGIPLSEASAGEPSTGTLDLGKAQPNPGLNLVAQPYQCTMCDRAFSQRGSLNRHMRSHLGVRPYSCPQCPMTFSRQYRVTEHMRVHQRGCEDLQRAGPT